YPAAPSNGGRREGPDAPCAAQLQHDHAPLLRRDTRSRRGDGRAGGRVQRRAPRHRFPRELSPRGAALHAERGGQAHIQGAGACRDDRADRAGWWGGRGLPLPRDAAPPARVESPMRELRIERTTYPLLRHLTLPVVAITTAAGGRTNGMIVNSAQRASLVP